MGTVFMTVPFLRSFSLSQIFFNKHFLLAARTCFFYNNVL